MCEILNPSLTLSPSLLLNLVCIVFYQVDELESLYRRLVATAIPTALFLNEVVSRVARARFMTLALAAMPSSSSSSSSSSTLSSSSAHGNGGDATMSRAKSTTPGTQRSASSSAAVPTSNDNTNASSADSGGSDEDSFASSHRAIDAAFSVIASRTALNATRQRLGDELNSVQHQSMLAIRAGTAVHVGLTKINSGGGSGLGEDALKLADHYIAQSGSNPNDVVEGENATATTTASPVPPAHTTASSATTTATAAAAAATADSATLADGEQTDPATMAAPEPDYSLPSPSAELASVLAAGFDPLDPFGSNVAAPQHLLLGHSAHSDSIRSHSGHGLAHGLESSDGSAANRTGTGGSAAAVLIRSLDVFVDDWTAKERLRAEQAMKAAADGISSMVRFHYFNLSIQPIVNVSFPRILTPSLGSVFVLSTLRSQVRPHWFLPHPHRPLRQTRRSHPKSARPPPPHCLHHYASHCHPLSPTPLTEVLVAVVMRLRTASMWSAILASIGRSIHHRFDHVENPFKNHHNCCSNPIFSDQHKCPISATLF
jgi:hypothetical protein